MLKTHSAVYFPNLVRLLLVENKQREIEAKNLEAIDRSFTEAHKEVRSGAAFTYIWQQH